MNNKIVQEELIKSLLLTITDSEQYLAIEYLVQNIRQPVLYYLSRFRINGFKTPSFLDHLVECVSLGFEEKGIAPNNMLNYMLDKDKNGWVHYFDFVFLRPIDGNSQKEIIECDRELFTLVLTGFILDCFRSPIINIRNIVLKEILCYDTNQFGLSIVNGVKFERDYFVFDNKAYLYSLLTTTSVISFTDSMPGFAKIITEQINNGDILLRLDERLAVPAEQAISYSTLNSEKFYGPQFHFSDSIFKDQKTIIVHIDEDTCDKLLMVIKKDYDEKCSEKFLHIEIEILPFVTPEDKYTHFITTFLHGMYYPTKDSFTHIDFTKNQYDFDDYVKKYSESTNDVPIDFYTEKNLHYKIWCVENGHYSKEVWYNLMVSSLSENHRKLLDEILR